ncbi:MAG: hypothetical protein H7836_10680 [Magnetococcus sp. YQC-3]
MSGYESKRDEDEFLPPYIEKYIVTKGIGILVSFGGWCLVAIGFGIIIVSLGNKSALNMMLGVSMGGLVGIPAIIFGLLTVMAGQLVQIKVDECNFSGETLYLMRLQQRAELTYLRNTAETKDSHRVKEVKCLKCGRIYNCQMTGQFCEQCGEKFS